jgi:uncharacterized protein YndB with AHSA1/START domain
MSEAAIDPVLGKADDRVTARFVLSVPHPRATVWSALTEPAVLPQWLAPGSIDQRDGGRVKLDFKDSGIVIDSEVRAFDPGYLLEYSWSGAGEPERPVRWELDDDNGGTRLQLTLGVPASEDVARACAGWSAHLDMLCAALEGVPIKFPFQVFADARARYRELVSAL